MARKMSKTMEEGPDFPDGALADPMALLGVASLECDKGAGCETGALALLVSV
jgi:hypothetical protein